MSEYGHKMSIGQKIKDIFIAEINKKMKPFKEKNVLSPIEVQELKKLEETKKKILEAQENE